MPLEANNTMISMRNITIRTAKSAPYLGNVGLYHSIAHYQQPVHWSYAFTRSRLIAPELQHLALLL